MSTLSVGRPAPDFSLPTDDLGNFDLSAQRGRPVVLFFYPADDTEGCTVENLEFTALREEFAALGAVVVGISPDSVEKHCAFRDKHQLGMRLAADPERRVIEAYGLWQLKKLYGVEFMGVKRTTFLIDPEGRIAGIFPATRIKGHAARVLEATRQLVASGTAT